MAARPRQKPPVPPVARAICPQKPPLPRGGVAPKGGAEAGAAPLPAVGAANQKIILAKPAKENGDKLTKTILDYAKGLLSHAEFEAELYLHPKLWDELQALMPEDASNPDSAFWHLFPNRKLLETERYRVKQALLAFGWRGSLAHALVSALVRYHDPSVEIREAIDDSDVSFLERNNLDYIGGPEVDVFVRELLLRDTDCSNQLKKQHIREAFHIQGRKRPRWVQEPEWPFQNGKPLWFVFQSHNGDLFEYLFDDPESGEQFTVTQLA